MIVGEFDDRTCPRCGGELGLGLGEEPTGWKAYAICFELDSECPDRTLGTVPRRSVDHLDEVVDRAEELAEQLYYR